MAGGCGVQLPKRQPALTRPAHSAQVEAKGEVSGLGISSPTTSSGSFLPGSHCALLPFRGSRTWELELAIYRRCRQAVRRREGWRDSSILEARNSQLHDAALPASTMHSVHRESHSSRCRAWRDCGTAGLRDGMDGWITAGWLPRWWPWWVHGGSWGWARLSLAACCCCCCCMTHRRREIGHGSWLPWAALGCIELPAVASCRPPLQANGAR